MIYKNTEDYTSQAMALSRSLGKSIDVMPFIFFSESSFNIVRDLNYALSGI